MDENTLLQLNDLLHDYGRAWQQIEQYTCPATQSAHIKARNAIVAFIEVQRQPGAAQETSEDAEAQRQRDLEWDRQRELIAAGLAENR